MNAASDLFRQPSEIIRAARTVLKPPPRLSLSEWAEQKYVLSADAGAAEPGRWRTLPYQREPMDAMTDVRVEAVSFMKSARVGYTEMLKALIAYHIEHDPCPILLVQPSEDDAKSFSKEHIDPMLRDCPDVGRRLVKRRNQTESMLLKRFRGGVLQIAGARSPANFRMRSRRKVLSDELDGYPPSAGGEGDPRELAEKRAESFWNRGFVRGSSPTDRGASRIEPLFWDGDQRRYYVPCPHCHEGQVLQFKNLRWPKGQPELAQFVCIHCETDIAHLHKRWMVEHGEWRPGPHPQFPDDPAPGKTARHRSYHIWSAYSFMPNATWGHIAQKFVAAKAAGAEQLKTFINTWLGETWKDKGEAPAWRQLYDRRQTYRIGTCPDGVRFLTAGVDVQNNRLVYEVVGWGRQKHSWSIERDVIAGDTSDLTTNGPWAKLDTLLDRTFDHEGGAQIRIRLLAVDSGDQTQTVYNWARQKDAGRVMVIKGSDSGDVLVSTPKKTDVTMSGKKVGKVLLWRVGKPIGTSELYGWLKLQLPTDVERAAGATTPPGYCHFPQYDEEYFKQLTALQLVTKKDGHGFLQRVWEMIPGREDHYLDSRRYARAAAAVVGLDRFRDAEWKLLEQALSDVAKGQASAPTTDAGEPVAPAASTPARLKPRRIGRSKYLG